MGQDVRYYIQDYVFTWDSDKAESNVKKHNGVSFEEAREVFFDPWYTIWKKISAPKESGVGSSSDTRKRIASSVWLLWSGVRNPGALSRLEN